MPAAWLAMQRRSIETLSGAFSAERMVREYAERFYFPSAERYRRLQADNGARVRALVAWKRLMHERWSEVRVQDVAVETGGAVRIHQDVRVTAKVALGSIGPGDVRVEAYHGEIDADGLVANGTASELAFVGLENGIATFSGSLRVARPGHAGVAVRVLPNHADLTSSVEMNLLTWAD